MSASFSKDTIINQKCHFNDFSVRLFIRDISQLDVIIL